MTTNEVKDKEQAKAFSAWVSAGCRGTLELCTSFGKTLLGIKAAHYFAKQANFEFKVLVLTPTEVIRDDTWYNEFKKWNLMNFYRKCVHTECIQTAYKWKDTEWDMVIADEFHNYIPDNEKYASNESEYIKFFYNNKIGKLMALTAKVPDNKTRAAYRIAPVCYRMSLQEAVEKGIVSPYKIFNCPVKFTPKEQLEYNKVQAAFVHAENVLGGSMFAYKRALTIKKNPQFHAAELVRAADVYQVQARRRASLLYKAENKLHACDELVDMFPDRKAIIFSESKEFSWRFAKMRTHDTVVYYSPTTAKAKKPWDLKKGERELNLSKFTDEETGARIMATVKALNEGVNVPSISLAALASGTSKPKDFIQRTGRAVRDETQLALVVNFYVENTQEINWVKSRTKGFETTWVNNLQEILLHL